MPTATGHTTAIRASDVIGTEVRNRAGESLGKVEDIVLDKTSNSIMFAVLSFGGFLGIGERYHPMPWAVLDYDPDIEAFVVDYSREQLESAPSDTIDELTRHDGVGFRDRAFEHYQVDPYW